MKSKKNKSLATQFFAMIAIIIVVFMSINAFFQYKNQTQSINRSLNERIESIAGLLAAISVEPLLTFDDVTLNGYAEFVSKQKDIVFATVVNENGVPLTHFVNFKNKYVKKIVSSDNVVNIKPVIEQLSKNEYVLTFKKKIIFENKVLAYAWVGLDRFSYIEKSLNILINIIFFTTIIGLIIGAIIYYLFKRKVFDPIEVLTKGTKNISNFKFEEKISVSGTGELVSLAESFDDMRLQLKDAVSSRDAVMKKVSELNSTLEDRVYERTAELKKLNAKIAHEAMHDSLTGLPNRALVMEQLQHAIVAAKRDDETLAVMMLDLNNFKEVNDTLGHPKGDSLLVDVAQRLSGVVRESDVVGRLGGDEFAVVLPNINKTDAIIVANKILSHLSPSFLLDDHMLKVGASIGVAMYPEHGEDHTDLIRVADVAMYEAKNDGSEVCVYHPEHDKYTPLRLSLMDHLHTALDENQLKLYYQPKISLRDNKVYSVEALIRWQHPELGFIYPDQFIPVAENSGLINDLSDWVLEQAFKQWHTWKEQGYDLQISVNLSARNLVNPELPLRIAEFCNKYNMHSHRIKAEITESALMYNPEQVMKMMADPNMQKIHFSIDDFGTGYSSLSYLKKLPVSEVKIDRSFVFDMVNDESDANIVKSVIDLVHNLGYSAVAEGVENTATLMQLKLLKCDEVQGYLFSKAVPASELIEKIKKIEQGLMTVI